MAPIRLSRAVAGGAALVLAAGLATTPAVAQSVYEGPEYIPTDRVAEAADALAYQATAEEWARDRTLPQDWNYELPEGVTTRQVSFYVDGGARLQGTLFLPSGFDTDESYGAVVVGHGINALAVGIEKYAARFAERGYVGFAIDYMSYGHSDSGSDSLQLLEPDGTSDDDLVTIRHARLRVKRTNLNNVHEIDAYRAAVSFLQGEPGVDPERIGVWGSSNAGIVLASVAGLDGRIKAAVIHVMGTFISPPRPVDLAGDALEDAIVRVRTGQGAETTAGFSFPTAVDLYYRTRNRDAGGGFLINRVRPRTAVLYLPAENDELIGGARSAIAGAARLDEMGVPSQVIAFPGMTHFQPYAGAGFEVGSHLSADWYDRFLDPERIAQLGEGGE